MMSAREALERLKEGNRRYASGAARDAGRTSESRRTELAASGQKPFAVILGCSDSRVPAEIVFDQGLGDLFVVRVAGNVVEPTLVGSVEFAAEEFGTELVVVLGHTRCGAVQATLQALERPAPAASPNLQAIVDHIRPSVEGLVASGLAGDALVQQAVRANVQASVARLRQASTLLETRIQRGLLQIVGAEYDLHTGEVRYP